ncbi:MAG TPA: MATE family efflux transporter [Rhizomicrobium sp.]|jgi:putative MATE family efflux protein|nr:MATE family efflux transporter [Rhizomicrobium sp.]
MNDATDKLEAPATRMAQAPMPPGPGGPAFRGRAFDPRLLEGSIPRSLFLLAFPIMGGNILQIAYQLVDAFWVGRLGAAAVASVSVSMPLMFLMMSLGMGFTIAGSTLIAQYVGARNRAMVDHVAGQTMLTVVAVSAILGAFGFLVAPALLHLMEVDQEVYDNALGFLRVQFLSLPLAFAYFCFQSQMRGVGQVTVPLYIIAGTVFVNFVLDPIFIFVMHWGVMGAALATMVSQFLSATAAIVLLMSGRYGIQLKVAELAPDFAFIKRAFNLGYPAAIEGSARGLGVTMMMFLITSFGTVTTAAYGVGGNVLQFVVIPAMGFSMATSTLVGQNIGAGNVKRAEAVARLAALITFATLSAVGLLALAFANHIAAFFVPNDRRVIHEASVFIRTVSWSFGFIGVQFALMGVLRASGNMFAAMVISLVSQWMLTFPLAFLLSHRAHLGAHGIWWAFPVANVITAVVSFLWFSRGDWKKRRLIAPETLEEEEQQAVSEEVIV